VLNAIRASLAFMTKTERVKLYLLVMLRATLALLDLAGILAIGFLVTSTVTYLSPGGSSRNSVNFIGLELPVIDNLTLPWILAGVIGLFLSKAFFSVLLTRKVAFFVARIEARASKKIAEISFGADLGQARMRSREEMMFAIQVGSPAAFNSLINSINTIITEATLFVFVIIGFLLVDPLATFVSLLYFGLVVAIMQFFIGSLMSQAGQISADKSVQTSTAISNLLAVFRELLVLGNREKYIDDIYQAKLASAKSSATQYYLGGMPRYIIETALLIGLARFVFSQTLTQDIVNSAGTIGIFLSGGFRLTAALLPLQSAVLTIKSIIPSAKTAHDILRLGSTIAQPKASPAMRSGVAKDPKAIGVEFKFVSFKYPGSRESAVEEISFTFEPGAQVALMGPSGAGKSTIADLICGIIKPTSGSIFVSGLNLADSTQRERGSISYVPQKPGLVSGTIVDNVALGVETSEIDRGMVREALRLSHLDNLISTLPEGIDTNLGKLQDGLSGGQIQRLGLARALYSRPGLLVMDEATSALDGESELEIQRAMSDMRGKVTVVLIAHRLNTIQHADHVILVEGGRVTDSGTFKQLQSRNPQVERLVELMRIDPI